MDPIESAGYDGSQTSDHEWTEVVNRNQRRNQRRMQHHLTRYNEIKRYGYIEETKQRYRNPQPEEGIKQKYRNPKAEEEIKQKYKKNPKAEEGIKQKYKNPKAEEEIKQKYKKNPKAEEEIKQKYKNPKAEEEIKKMKQKKEEKMAKEASLAEAAAEIDSGSEKPKQVSSLADAAAKIDSESEKPKQVSLAEAAAKIDASHLAAYLSDSPNWYPGIGVLNLVDYFVEALSEVSSEQFEYPWPNMNNLTDMIDVPFTYIPQAVYKTAGRWLDKGVEHKIVCSFVVWSFGYTHARLLGMYTSPTKTQLAVFVVLSIILRNNPVVLLHILTILEEPPYQTEDAHDMFLFTVWMMAQATQVDLCLGLYSWSHNLLPLLRDKNIYKPESMDIVLQLIEKIVSYPNARTIILSNAVKDEEVRILPMSSFGVLLRLTFPDPSDRVKDTKRFEAVYPLLKEVALADAPGEMETRLVTTPIFVFCLEFAAQGNNPPLAKEATSIAVWCLTKNVECCNHWNYVYNENPEGSLALLKKLVDEWKEHSIKLTSSPRDTGILKRTMKSFALKNKEGITQGGAKASVYTEADKYVNAITTALMNQEGTETRKRLKGVLFL